MTIAFDYDEALKNLDRGVETHSELGATKEWAQGVAMTPVVLRDNEIKSHILMNAGVASWLLEEPETQNYREAIHVFAHECAHVEINAAFDRCFPGQLLKKKYNSWYDSLRGETIGATWDEYAATRICAGFGADPTENYETIFLNILEESGPNVRTSILKYRMDGNIDELVVQAQLNIGNLFKMASYLLGTADGFGRNLETDMPRTWQALDEHWFKPFFHDLHEAFRHIWKDFGQWESYDSFEEIADIWLRAMKDRGLVIEPKPDGDMHVKVPFTSETSPLQAMVWHSQQAT
ncbi:hypothetical protein K3720_02120 [Leisingera caerulea]|uniref:hypothetical protein n=1 Tax=Leisingera caerulea TaxID=506591 RepID=UPI0021A387BB|nr:hypothetical protein [Leisingera caerulea]UWQ50226.1 hypothetical protein K3720_02120 [Leisingera caerulea]